DCAADEKSVVVLNADRDTVPLKQWEEFIELALIALDRWGIAGLHVDRRHDADKRDAGGAASCNRRLVRVASDAGDLQPAFVKDANSILESRVHRIRRHLVAGPYG